MLRAVTWPPRRFRPTLTEWWGERTGALRTLHAFAPADGRPGSAPAHRTQGEDYSVRRKIGVVGNSTIAVNMIWRTINNRNNFLINSSAFRQYKSVLRERVLQLEAQGLPQIVRLWRQGSLLVLVETAFLPERLKARRCGTGGVAAIRPPWVH